MRRDELHYELPQELIAQRAVEPRDAARLLVLERATGALRHHVFRELPDLLRPGDVLVRNDTKVLPARFRCLRASGGRIEVLYLQRAEPDGWAVLLKPSRRLAVGERLRCAGSAVELELLTAGERGAWTVRPIPAVEPEQWLPTVGAAPLPPYIARAADAGDTERYQTIYAATPGAVAAPTAGLHFTPAVFEALAERGVGVVNVTLHVGIGTFQPIAAETLADHRMHAEWYRVSADACRTLAAARAAGRRLVAVGTTSTRVLESLPSVAELVGAEADQTGWTEIFIYPPYRARNVDALITNFHLPGSTLIAMVMALAGEENIRQAYAAAIAERYRFYSYGDAMLIA
jgi:S-adenosylmethionine:tRNA ribosyltransferase-isomerase